MQIKFKDGKPVVTLTVNEQKTIANCHGIMKELARYPEQFTTAATAAQALGGFAEKKDAK